MKKLRLSFILTILLLALIFPGNTLAAPVDDGDNGGSLATDQILVKFKPGVSPSEMAEVHRQLGGRVKKDISQLGVQVVSIPSGKAIEKIRAYSAHSRVAYAEPDYLAETA